MADVLARGAADAALVIATDPASNFPKKAFQTLRRIPVISLDTKQTETSKPARAAFTVATYGINTGGTVYRMDDAPITLHPTFDSPYPPDEEILSAIRDKALTLRRQKSAA